MVGRGADLRAPARAERGRRAVQLHRRPDHREQPDGRPPRLGPDAQGRLPALQGAARLRPALPERLRLPGAVGRGRGGEVARPELEARHRGVRARRVRRPLPGARRPVRRGDHRAGSRRLGTLDGLGQRLLHLLGHEHRVHLALPEATCTSGAGSTRAIARPSGARAAARRSHSTSRPARRTTRSSSIRRSTSASRSRTATARRWSSGRRRPGRCRRTSPRRSSRTRSTGCATAAGRLREEDAEYDRVVRGEELVGLEYEGPFDDLAAQQGVDPPRHPVGRGLARPRARGSSTSRPARARRTSSSSRVHDLPVIVADRRVGANGAPATASSQGLSTDEVEEPVIESLRERGLARRAPAGSPTATRSAGAARRRSSSASSTTGSSPRTRSGSRCSTRTRPSSGRRLLLEADGRLAAQHGRLEHLAQAVLRAAAALLPVRLRRT